MWGETESLGTAATTGLLYQPQMIVDGDYIPIYVASHLSRVFQVIEEV
jgi:poly-D-alanine transfer protein DltD